MEPRYDGPRALAQSLTAFARTTADATWNPNPVGSVLSLAANATELFAGRTFTPNGRPLSGGPPGEVCPGVLDVY